MIVRTYAEAVRAIALDPLAYLEFPQSVCSREVKIIAMRRNGILLQTLSLRDRTLEMCLAALSQTVRALAYVPGALRDDPRVVAAIAAAPAPTPIDLAPQLASFIANDGVAYIELDDDRVLSNVIDAFRPIEDCFVDIDGESNGEASRMHAVDAVEFALTSFHLTFSSSIPTSGWKRIAIWTANGRTVISWAPIGDIPPELRAPGLEPILASAHLQVTGNTAPPLDKPVEAVVAEEPYEDFWDEAA